MGKRGNGRERRSTFSGVFLFSPFPPLFLFAGSLSHSITQLRVGSPLPTARARVFLQIHLLEADAAGELLLAF